MFTVNEFSDVLRLVSIANNPNGSKRREFHGVAWFGEEAADISPTMARNIASHSGACEVCQIAESDGQAQQLQVVRSMKGNAVMAISPKMPQRQIIPRAIFMEDYFLESPETFTELPAGKVIAHPFIFTCFHASTVNGLRRKIGEFLGAGDIPDRMWAFCCNAYDSEINLAIFSMFEDGVEQQEACDLRKAVEGILWEGESIQPTVCLFWWQPDFTQWLGKANSRPVMTRVRVRTATHA